VDELTPLAHVICHREEHRGESRHRYQCGPLADEQKDEKEKYAMDQGGKRSFPTGLDIRRGTRDGACRRYTAKNDRSNVSCSLCDQFHVRSVTRSRHSISDDGGQERFEAGEDRYRQRRHEHLLDELQRHRRQVRRGQCVRHIAKPRPNGIYRQMEELHGRGHQQYCDQLARHPASDPRPEDYYQQRKYANTDRIVIKSRQMLKIDRPFCDEVRRDLFDLKPEKVADLRRRNDQSYPGRESDDDRVRDKFEECTHPGDAHCDEQNTGDERCDDQAVVAVLFDDAVNNYDEGACRTADLCARAAKNRYDRSGKDRGVKALLGLHS